MTTAPRLDAPPEAADDEPQVRQLMTPHVVAIVPDADLLIASRVMTARRVRHLPVMDGTHCRGLLLEIDVLQALALADNPLVRPPRWPASSAAPFPRCGPRTGGRSRPGRCAPPGSMRCWSATAGRVVGILTATDLVRSLAAEAGPGPAVP